MVESSSETMAGLLPVANITLTDENIVQITTIVKDSLNVELPLMVSSIITGVLEGLQSKITSLEVENSQLRSRVDLLESKVDKTEQYSRRNCLRLSGINETDGESVDNKVMEIANALGTDILLEEIDRSHRLGKQKDSGRPRDIIIKFTSYRSRQKLFTYKKQLKASGCKGVFINEDLTFIRDKIFNQAREMFKNKLNHGTWTKDGIIMIKDKNNKLHRVETMQELDRLKSQFP